VLEERKRNRGYALCRDAVVRVLTAACGRLVVMANMRRTQQHSGGVRGCGSRNARMPWSGYHPTSPGMPLNARRSAWHCSFSVCRDVVAGERWSTAWWTTAQRPRGVIVASVSQQSRVSVRVACATAAQATHPTRTR